MTNFELAERGIWLKFYGECLTKTKAAKLLGKCRRTVYNMLADGRLRQNADGSVSTRSVYAYVRGVKE